jgi:hypothetical protein
MIVPILLIGLALILAYIGSRKQLSRVQLAFVLVFFAIGVASVLFQDLTMRAAAYLNVGRGADLLLYFSVLFGVMVAAHFYFRFKEMERILVEIVRRIAIASPRSPTAESSGK